MRSVIKLASGVQLGSFVLASSLSDKSSTLSLVNELKLCILISSIPFRDRSNETKWGSGSMGSTRIPQLDKRKSFSFGRKWKSSCAQQQQEVREKCKRNNIFSLRNIINEYQKLQRNYFMYALPLFPCLSLASIMEHMLLCPRQMFKKQKSTPKLLYFFFAFFFFFEKDL